MHTVGKGGRESNFLKTSVFIIDNKFLPIFSKEMSRNHHSIYFFFEVKMGFWKKQAASSSHNHLHLCCSSSQPPYCRIMVLTTVPIFMTQI